MLALLSFVPSLLARRAFGRAINRVASSIPWQLWAAAACALTVIVGAWWIDARAYNRGYDAAETVWEDVVQREYVRQLDANKEALRIANEEIQRLREAKDVRDAEIERLINEARQDPDAGRPALSAGSVRRLNSVLE